MLSASALDKSFGRLDSGYTAELGKDKLFELREEMSGPAVRSVDYRSSADGSARRSHYDPASGVPLRYLRHGGVSVQADLFLFD